MVPEWAAITQRDSCFADEATVLDGFDMKSVYALRVIAKHPFQQPLGVPGRRPGRNNPQPQGDTVHMGIDG